MAKKSDGATKVKATAATDAILDCDETIELNLQSAKKATPHEVVCAMIVQGWSWCSKSAHHITMEHEEFRYPLHATNASWLELLTLWQEYGYHLAKRYSDEFGHYNTKDENEH